MTIAQIKKACRDNRYIILRHISGCKVGFNTKCIDLMKLKPEQTITDWMSYYPCGIQEYINFKIPY